MPTAPTLSCTGYAAALGSSTQQPLQPLCVIQRHRQLDRCSSSLVKVSLVTSIIRIAQVCPLRSSLLFLPTVTHMLHRCRCSVWSGSQRAGAGLDLVRAFPYIKAVYDEADEALQALSDPPRSPLSHLIWHTSQVSGGSQA